MRTDFNYEEIQYVKNIELRANQRGFVLQESRYGGGVSLKLKDDHYPVYSRDAELFLGNIRDIGAFLTGLDWAQDYDRMIGLSNETKRLKREQIIRNQQLMRMIKSGKKVDGFDPDDSEFGSPNGA